ncbi:hypothetical protein AEGHOMDF_3357 [Methylobacterium soli]|nr:hypothetical protein AEGHOMDF_3357 [Methylobacterium soli]
MQQQGEAVADRAGDQQRDEGILLDAGADDAAAVAQVGAAPVIGVAGIVGGVVGDVAQGVLGLAVGVLGLALRLAEAPLDGIARRSDEVARGALNLAAEFLGGAGDAIRINHGWSPLSVSVRLRGGRGRRYPSVTKRPRRHLCTATPRFFPRSPA